MEDLSLWWIRYPEEAGPKEIKDSEYILRLASGNVIKLSMVRTKGLGAYFQDNEKCSKTEYGNRYKILWIYQKAIELYTLNG